MYGQTDPQAQADQRGVIPPDAANALRRIRAGETWVRYDSIVIGQGAQNLSRGWFNTWNQFAQANRLEFFSSRDPSVGFAYCNQNGERTDWANDLYQAHMEFFAPPVPADIASDNNDAQNTPFLFMSDLPPRLSVSVKLSESDEILKVPANFIPAGHGIAYPAVAAAASPVTLPGTQGMPSVGNGFKWIEPIMLAAKSKLTVVCEIDQPIRNTLLNLPGPGTVQIPDGAGGTIEMPIWYVIRFSFVGQRYLQLRGARSSA